MTRIGRINADNEGGEGVLRAELTDGILKAFYRVYNELGYGFLEKVYENDLVVELGDLGMSVLQQQPIQVLYRKQSVGEYFADLIVNDTVIVELKAAEHIHDEHVAQLINYLKATRKEVGLLLNFGAKPEFKRIVFSNPLKNPR